MTERRVTRTIFIELREQGGVTECWPADEGYDALMRELGWVRIEHAAAYVAKNPCDRATWNGNGAVSVTAVDEDEG